MAKPATASQSPMGRRLLSLAGRLVVRLYALAILLIVLWAGYTAIAYLARYVFEPGRVPEQFLDPLAAAPPVEASGTPPGLVTGQQADISHYHRDPQPFAILGGADVAGGAGCATSGCHTMLPHARRKEVRAFANFHTTFLDCWACHDAAITGPTQAVWLNNATGRRQEPPAILRLLTLLQTRSDELQSQPDRLSDTVIDLLRQAQEQVGVDPPLRELLIRLDTSQPGSPVWRQAMSELQASLPNRVRGEYAARIAPAAVADTWTTRRQRMEELARQYAAAPENSPRREELNQAIHEGVLAQPDACMTCHGGEPARFDFVDLGYSPQRAAELHATPIAQMIQHIREGRPFYYFSSLLQAPVSTRPAATRPAGGTHEVR